MPAPEVKNHAVWLTPLLVTLFYLSAQAVAADTEKIAQRDLSGQIRSAQSALSNIAAPAVVYVGEIHDQLSYHLNQLAVIMALRERGLNVAIGMEMIQTPFQRHLDDYIAGHIDFVTMLERTEYFTRWRYDARLYQPIFQYAKEHRLPLIALNAPRELTERVSAAGIEGLNRDERSTLPNELTPLAPEYRTLLEKVFSEHDKSDDMDIERFIEVQQTWDETMAKTSAEFLRDHSNHVLVVLAGVQHVAHGYGIPSRVENYAGLQGTVILSKNEQNETSDGADVFLDLVDTSLAKSGRMGVFIKTAPSGAVIDGFAEGSPAKEAGVEEQDTIVEVNGRSVKRFEDIKLALWDKVPGDPVLLAVQRNKYTRLEMSFDLY